MRSPRLVRPLMGVGFACLLTSLGGCATSGSIPALQQEPLPAVPTHLRTCFQQVTGLPAGAWTSAQTAEVIGKLRKSELDKTDCGRQLLQFYDEVAAGRCK